MSAPNDPSELSERQATLTLARRGTEFFGHELDRLTDNELDGDSLMPGWTRRQVVAHVASNARALGRLARWADTGIETVMYASVEERNAEITAGSILCSVALRDAWADSAVDLDRCWRELSADRWSNQVRNGQGAMIPLADSIWMRSRELWIHAVDLNNGAGFVDLPKEFLTRLLGDITRAWSARGDGIRRLIATDWAHESFGDSDATENVAGSLADVAAWAAGRSRVGVISEAGQTPIAPRWL